MRHLTYSALAPIFILFSFLFQFTSAATVLKYNIGGLKIGQFDNDPTNFILGASVYYRSPYIPGLTTGLSHRWGKGAFSYQFPTGNGVFDIDLIFAEVYKPSQSVGKRIFDVIIEDKSVIKNLDVFAAVGANKELTKSFKGLVVSDGALTINFLKGASENPMVSAIILKSTNGQDLEIGTTISGEGISKQVPKPLSGEAQPEFDHQAHAVAGGPYVETDFNSDGIAKMDIDGSLSHSHFNNPDTGESGKIVSYQWSVGGKVISTKQIFSASFKLGKTPLQLVVKDQTGDTASAQTEVQILPSAAGGAYCYYYNGATVLPAKITSDPKPDEGHPANVIDFQNDDEFPYSKKDTGITGSSKWAARCITDFVSKFTKQYKLTISYKGSGATLFVNGAQKITGGPSGGGFKDISAVVTIPAGIAPIQILYYKSGADGGLSLKVDNFVAQPSVLGFKASTVIPTISAITVNSVPPQGGGQMMISGTAFFNDVQVSIGNFKPKFVKVSASQIIVETIPSQAQAGAQQAPVVVFNLAGQSNAIILKYDKAATAAVAWEQTFLKTPQGGKYSFKQITSIRIGPDSKYYVAGLNGVVSKFDAGKDLVVTGFCSGKSLGNGRAILGIAFNPKDPVLRVYASSNSLYWGFGGPFKGKPDGWANGAVETFTNGCGCLCHEGKKITGLPVSNHDHGVNQLQFLNGDLLIAVGGFTNAGYNTPNNKLGGVSENPLSGTILIAKVSKPNFNGAIKYNQYGDPSKAKKISGDVSIFASGVRNSFGLEVDSYNQVWATDNGGNFGYGDVSTSCTTQAPFKTKKFDELNLIQPGKFYGHPNRNRGQCVYDAGEKPKAVVVSSTTGVVEYTSNAFNGQLKSELILSKYAASGTGVTWRVPITNTPTLTPAQMTQYSGIAIITGKHGELVMPRVQQGHIAVLKPKYPNPGVPRVIAVSPRRSFAGSTVFVSGDNFGAGLTVKFGAAPAVVTQPVYPNGFYCKVPGGSGKVVVTVTVKGSSSTTAVGHDFIYA